jgi:F-type H+-transporting ATPase subunit epsilon
MATFHVELVPPEELLFSGEVDQVGVAGSEGHFGVLGGCLSRPHQLQTNGKSP